MSYPTGPMPCPECRQNSVQARPVWFDPEPLPADPYRLGTRFRCPEGHEWMAWGERRLLSGVG